MKILYQYGWVVGKIEHYNFKLNEYKVTFSDGDPNWISPEIIDDYRNYSGMTLILSKI